MKRKTFFKKIPSEEITPLEIYMRFLDDKNSVKVLLEFRKRC